MRLLPDEILVEILVRVPIESLLVHLILCCKKWRDLILDASFARLHLHQWRSSSGFCFCTLYNNPTFFIDRNSIYPLNKKDDIVKHFEENCFRRMDQLTTDEPAVCRRVLDSCDGLLLIELCFIDTIGRRQLLVCNPVISYFKLLPPPPANNNIVYSECHWNIVYDASVKRYKVVGITKEFLYRKSSTGERGRTVYIFDQLHLDDELELERGGGWGWEWKKFCVSPALDFGGRIVASLFEKGKLYYLTKFKLISTERMYFRTNLIYMDVATHKVEATASDDTEWAELHGEDTDSWIASNGRFYFFSNSFQDNIVMELFVLKYLEGDPIWSRVCQIVTIDIREEIIEPLTVLLQDAQHDDDGYCKILCFVNRELYEYITTRGGGEGLWKKVSNGNGSDPGIQDTFLVPHVHSLIKCNSSLYL